MDKSMESVMWQVIEDMNFNERGHNGAGLYLTNESGLSLDGMRKVESFARLKCRQLYQQLFDVKVVSVNTLLQPLKKRRVGKFIGIKSRYKRAIVTLAPQDSITLFEDA